MNIIMFKDGEKLKVRIPYTAEDARDALKKLGAKWNPSETCWELSAAVRTQAAKILWEHFGGYNSYMKNGAAVTLKALEEVGAGRSSISFFGREIIIGSGRDSGARPGAGVAILEGKIGTNGSARYWRTYAAKGTVIRVEDLDLEALKEDGVLNVPKYWEVLSIEAPKAPVQHSQDVKRIIDDVSALSADDLNALFAILRERYPELCA